MYDDDHRKRPLQQYSDLLAEPLDSDASRDSHHRLLCTTMQQLLRTVPPGHPSKNELNSDERRVANIQDTHGRALQSDRVPAVLCGVVVVVLPHPLTRPLFLLARAASPRLKQSVRDQDLLELGLERGQRRLVLLHALRQRDLHEPVPPARRTVRHALARA